MTCCAPTCRSRTRRAPTYRDAALSTADLSRRDEGLALRALRVGVHPDALVIRSGTDVVVRTPARPDHLDGNVVDLLVPPAAEAVRLRIEAARRLMEPLGVAQLRLRYGLGVGSTDDPARSDAFTAASFTSERLRVHSVPAGRLPSPPAVLPASITVERLDGPDGDVIAGRRWYAAAVLDRYAHGEDVTRWRAWDEEWGTWQRQRITALARAGRAEVWLASRHGMPVATLTLVDDQDGLVVVENIVTHPAHRRRGIAQGLLGAAMASLSTSRALERVALAIRPDDPAERLCAAFDLRPVGDVVAWTGSM